MGLRVVRKQEDLGVQLSVIEGRGTPQFYQHPTLGFVRYESSAEIGDLLKF